MWASWACPHHPPPGWWSPTRTLSSRYVSLVGLGKAAKTTSTSSEWGPSPFLALGGAVASLTKANKSRTVGVAFVSPPSAEAAALTQQVSSGLHLPSHSR